MGLYRSGAAYCSSASRRFSAHHLLSRHGPVFSRFTRRGLEAAVAEAPLLLGNGNLVETGFLAGGQHHSLCGTIRGRSRPTCLRWWRAIWRCVYRNFTTASGRTVKLGIHVEKGKEDRCAWAMDSLVRSMQWDERVFGRE